jgi:hypothetical protein
MNRTETILAPNQRIALIAVEDFVHSGKQSAVLLAPRGCGTTTLFQSLVHYQGFGGQPIQFLYRNVTTKRSPLDQLPCQVERLNHRVIFLQDRATNVSPVQRLAMQSNAIQFIQARPPAGTLSSLRSDRDAQFDAEMTLTPLDAHQMRRFLDDHQFIKQGRRISFSEQDLESMHRETGGRLRDLVPLLKDKLKSTNPTANPNCRPQAA